MHAQTGVNALGVNLTRHGSEALVTFGIHHRGAGQQGTARGAASFVLARRITKVPRQVKQTHRSIGKAGLELAVKQTVLTGSPIGFCLASNMLYVQLRHYHQLFSSATIRIYIIYSNNNFVISHDCRLQ